jgi:hypothetical protein
MWIPWRNDDTGLANDQGGISNVGHDAGRSARHCFADGQGKGFTARRIRGYIHPGKKTRHILTHP